MNKLCFLLLLLAALGGLPMVFSPLSAEGILGYKALLYIPPIVMALQAAAPRNNPALSLMAFGLNFWGLTNGNLGVRFLAIDGCLALPCGLLLHAVVRAFRPGDRRLLLLLTLFAGIFGMHRFYAGRPLSGLCMLMLTPLGLILLVAFIGVFPLSAVTIWVLIDLVFVASGRFRDGQGRCITGRQDEGRDESNSRSRRRLTLLTIFLGVVGAHRFLVRRPYTGLCMLCLFLVNVYYLQYGPLLTTFNGNGCWWLLTFPLQLSWLLSDIAAVSYSCFREGTRRPATA